MFFVTSRLIRCQLFVPAIVVLNAIPIEATATPIASESFNYSPVPAELNTQNGGTGFSGAWTAVVANSEVIDPTTPLTYTAGSLDITGGNRTAVFDGSQGSVATRTLSVPQTSDFYFSYLVRFNGTPTSTDRFLLFGFNGNRVGGGVADSPGIGTVIDNEGGDDFLIRSNIASATGSTSGGGVMSANSTYLLVGKLEKNTGTDRFDHIDLWINPTTATEPAATMNATFTDAITLAGTITGLRLRTSQVTSSTYDLDEVRIGTTWADVVPVAVPEPGSIALMFCGAFALLWAVRRRMPTIGTGN